MIIKGQNVGIGNVNPQHKLHVTGNMHATGVVHANTAQIGTINTLWLHLHMKIILIPLIMH